MHFMLEDVSALQLFGSTVQRNTAKSQITAKDMTGPVLHLSQARVRKMSG
jgi:hypothetical protein